MQAHSEYTSRLANWRAILKSEEAMFRQVGNTRLAILAACAVMIWGVAFRQWFNLAWMAAPVAIFIALVIWHESIVTRISRVTRAIRFYERNGFVHAGEDVNPTSGRPVLRMAWKG